MKFSRDSKSALADKLPRIIYVEGKDDAWFIDGLLTEIGADPHVVGIVFMEGNGAIEKELAFLVKSGSYVQKITTHVALLLDADESAADTINKVHQALQDRGMPSPEHGETVGYDDGRVAGLFIFPDGNSAGEVEDLLLATVSADDRLTTVANALDQVEQTHGLLSKRSKRLARMFISVAPIKPCGVGRAYCEGLFPAAHPAVSAVRDFLCKFVG